MQIISTLRQKFFSNAKPGLGTFFGVYLPNILCIIGVIFYMRLGVLLGHVGPKTMLAIVCISFLITMLTALSLSSTATNGKIGAGGTYYMVSRCFGLEVGSTIGIALYFSQVLTAAFCVCGFAESMHLLLPWLPERETGVITLCLLAALSSISTSLVLKTQVVIFALLALSMASLFMGSPLPAVSELPSIPHMGFWAAFAIFFPAATGIESGLAMSGELRNPGKSLPIGSILTVLSAIALYIGAIYFLSGAAPLELLATDPLLMTRVSASGTLIYIGIWGAILSSILSGLLAAPRTLAALANDGVVPSFIGRTFGGANEPRIAVLVTFFFILCAVYWGSIDLIGPILSMFMLMAYAMLNLSTAFEELIGNPSWRPSFRLRWGVSALGGLLSLMAMFMIDAGASFISIALALGVYWIMKRRKLDTHMNDIRHALFAYLARWVIYRLDAIPLLPRSWRPNFLVFTDSPTRLIHSQLLKITTAITKERGFLTIASVLSGDLVTPERAASMKTLIHESLLEENSGALMKISLAKDTAAGMHRFIESYGIGPITPNTIVMEEMSHELFAKNGMAAMNLARSAKKNVLIIGEGSEIEKPSSIDIWWDNSSRSNSALMLLVAYLLKKSHLWKKVPVFVKTVVNTEIARGQREEYFTEFLKKSRLPFIPKIYVTPNLEMEKVTHAFSEKTACVMVGMRPPKDEELVSTYVESYGELQKQVAHFPVRLLCSCFEEIDLSKVFD